MILVEEFFYLEGLLEIFLPIGPLIPAEARVKTSEAKRPNNTESQPNPDPKPRAPGKNNQKPHATPPSFISIDTEPCVVCVGPLSICWKLVNCGVLWLVFEFGAYVLSMNWKTKYTSRTRDPAIPCQRAKMAGVHCSRGHLQQQLLGYP